MVDLKIQLPDSFLEEEIRDGYTISHNMKEIWAVELDLLSEFDRVCKKNGINYIASGGTMLGAIRHNGYIPWDDDLDLMLPRKDYERLCTIASEEFQYPYFFQTEFSDPGYLRGFARLRNSETSGIQRFEFNKRYRFNQGIFIDIFPMDEVVSEKKKLNKQGRKVKRLYSTACILSEMTNRFPPSRKPYWKYLYKCLGHYLFGSLINKFHLQKYYFKKFENACTQYNGTGQEVWSLLSFQFTNRRHDLPVYDVKDIIHVDFEFTTMPVPKNYKIHLKNKYGDYMRPRKVPNYHGDVIFDVNKSYKDILDI